uniref:Uncharacterized protein LOC104237859 n=1 Tax=Nicotiana sylvestris TaxID=4096 RepID=A0A1U7XV98_NICSY|nr:PREDICTED: uncharacterized protein LOC104237859 [Nicotiana sylvestris]
MAAPPPHTPSPSRHTQHIYTHIRDAYTHNSSISLSCPPWLRLQDLATASIALLLLPRHMLPAMAAFTALQNDQNISSLMSAMAASPSSSNEHEIPSYCCPLFLLLRSSLLLFLLLHPASCSSHGCCHAAMDNHQTTPEQDDHLASDCCCVLHCPFAAARAPYPPRSRWILLLQDHVIVAVVFLHCSRRCHASFSVLFQTNKLLSVRVRRRFDPVHYSESFQHMY